MLPIILNACLLAAIVSGQTRTSSAPDVATTSGGNQRTISVSPGPWSVLRIENLDEEDIDTPIVLAPGQPDLSDAVAMVQAICKGRNTDAEKAAALLDFVREHIRLWAPPCPADAGNPIRVLNAYGYGNCTSFAQTLSWLANCAGLEARVVSIPGHALSEIFHDGAWHAYDANGDRMVRKEDGTLASAEEIHLDPALLDRSTTALFPTPDTFDLEALKKAYASGVSYSDPLPAAADCRIAFVLHPEESIEWYLGDRVRCFPYQSPSFMGCPPRNICASGTLFYRPNLSLPHFRKRWGLGQRQDDLVLVDGKLTVSQAKRIEQIRMKWDFPWPVVGGRLILKGYRSRGAGSIRCWLHRPDDLRRIELGEIVWDLPGESGEFERVADLGIAAVLPAPAPLYAVDLELRMFKSAPDARLEISAVQVEVDLQRAPKTLPPPILPETLIYRDSSPGPRRVRVTLRHDANPSPGPTRPETGAGETGKEAPHGNASPARLRHSDAIQ